MKKLLFLSTFILLLIKVNGQVLTVNESFETWPPSDWTIETLGAGNGWTQDWQGVGHTGNHSAYSSIANSQVNNWLVSPQVSITSDTYELKFWESNTYVEYFDNIAVYISTASNDPTSGDFLEIYNSDDAPLDWTERVIDLSSYVGEDIYIAFQYEGTWHVWFVDDVTISPNSFTDGELATVNSPTGVSETPVTEDVIVNLKNNGSSTINDLVIGWEVNGVIQSNYSNATLNLLAGENTNITLGSYDFNSFGAYDIEAYVSIADDEINYNDTVHSIFQVSSFKDLSIYGINPESMEPLSGLLDVSVLVENKGINAIDTIVVNWDVDEIDQVPFTTNSLNLNPGESTELVIGQYNFATGVFDINATIDALGDNNELNDHYHAYAAIDTLWESFEGRVFPPENWNLYFGVLDNINFDTPPQGDYYYAPMSDDNFFGIVTDTLYTPLLSIQEGDHFKFKLKTSAFNLANHSLFYKDVNGQVTLIQDISSTPNIWYEVDIDISAAAGTNYIGISTSSAGVGTSRIDFIRSDARLNMFDHDLAIKNGEMYFLAKQNITESFPCLVKNRGALQVLGSLYKVNLKDENGNLIAESNGVTIDPNEEIIINVNYSFSEIAQHRLHFEIQYAADEFQNDNTFRASDVNVVPNSIYLNEVSEPGNPNLNFPFNANGNTQSLGEDDLSQTIYLTDEFEYSGEIYGFIYNYQNLLGADIVKKMPLKVWVTQSSVEDLSNGWIQTDELTLVYDDTLEILPGMERQVYIPFNEPILYTGIDNFIIQDYQYDPAWPPSILRFIDSSLPQGGPVRTIIVSDYYQLDPNEMPEFYNTFSNIAFTTFVIDPIVEYASVDGHVYSSLGDPLSGATVSVDNTSISAQTDINGYYEFPQLPYGNYNFTAGILAYNDSTIPLSISEASFTQDFYLNERVQVQLIGSLVGSNDLSIPLENVHVSAIGYTEDDTFTSTEGNFLLENIFGISDYELTFSLYGYYDKMITVSVTEFDIDLGEIVLQQEFLSPFDVFAEAATQATVIWKNPLESQKIKLQNDLNMTSYSYTNESNENVWLGNYFDITDTTTITSVEFKTDVYLNATDTITIDVFDEAGVLLVSSRPFLIYVDSVQTIDIPNIVVYNAIYAMIHWQDNEESTNALCLDYSDENIANTAAIKYPSNDIVLLSDFFGEGTPNMSFLLRVNTLDEGSQPTNNEELSYNIYRGLASEFPSTSNWEMMNSTPISDLSFIDANWTGTDPNEEYRYAIETIYTEGTSELTFSNTIQGISVGVNEIFLEDIKISVYPNPVSDLITVGINSDGDNEAIIQLFDAGGKAIEQSFKLISNNTEKINVSGLSNGIYFLRFEIEGLHVSKKIIVKH